MSTAPQKNLRVVVIDAGLPNPEFDAGSRALLDFISIVKEGSQPRHPEVHFLAMDVNRWGREKDLIQQDVHIHPPRDALSSVAGQQTWLDAMAPDFVVVSRPGPASQWLPTVMAHRRAGTHHGPRFLYYGIDIHHQRLASQLQFDPQPGVSRQQKLYQALEPAIWDHFSTVIYGSRAECAHVNNRFPNKAVHMPLYLIRDTPRPPCDAASLPHPVPVLLWVGGAHHAPNQDALRFVIRDVLPKIDASLVLHVAGDWPLQIREHPDFRPRQRNHAVHWLGLVGQAQLDDAYQTCTFALATLRFGAGVKGKVFEAIARQCPVLTTPIGAQGFEHLAWPKLCLTEPQPHAIAERIEQLLDIPPRQRFAQELRAMKLDLVRESRSAPLAWANLIRRSPDRLG